MDDRLARAMAVRAGNLKEIFLIIDEKAIGYRAQLDHLMQSKPETLTGKTAIAKSNRMKALLDLKFELSEMAKLAESQ